MILIIILLMFQGIDSDYLNSDELKYIHKGISYTLSFNEEHYNFSYDIWKNKYYVYNKTENKSFKNPDDFINYLKNKFNLESIFIEEKVDKGDKKRTIILFDFVSNLLSNKKREIIF